MASLTSKPVHSKDMSPMDPNPLLSMIKHKLFSTFPQPPPSVDFFGQTVIVTGASGGLGRESAKHFLSLNLSHLILAVRSVERGQSTAEELQIAYPKAKIEVWALEMESYESVQSFAKRCDRDLQRVDIAILNAGMGDMELKFSSSGHEMMMQVNYWSTALLAILMLPIMKAKSTASTPHLTIINSDMSRMCKVPNRKEVPFLASFDDEKWWNYQERYGESKLAGQLFFRRLAEHVSSDDVIINLVEPGFTKGTDLLRNGTGVFGAVFRMMRDLFAHPAVLAALTYVDAAAVKGKESHGCMVDKNHIGPYARISYGPEGETLMDGVWEETLEEFERFGAREIVQSMEAR